MRSTDTASGSDIAGFGLACACSSTAATAGRLCLSSRKSQPPSPLGRGGSTVTLRQRPEHAGDARGAGGGEEASERVRESRLLLNRMRASQLGGCPPLHLVNARSLVAATASVAV